MATTAALLLAAGESRRMGRLKALLPWQGATLVAHQIAALKSAGVDKVVLVLGYQADLLRAAVEPMLRGSAPVVTCTVNHQYQQGKTTSIRAGLAAMGNTPCDTLLILNVDQPRSAEVLRRLLEAHRHGGGLITIPTHQGKGGHPIILDGSLRQELAEIDEATQGLRAMVKRHQDSLQKVEMAEAEVLWDLNTPEQYQAAVQGQGRTP
ncbi:MAG: nucleotidyltransferase family protein [SAR202 cluster bacterium]|nr:nucleotidyltransferase family protein [SAR202 cluster bacterium]